MASAFSVQIQTVPTTTQMEHAFNAQQIILSIPMVSASKMINFTMAVSKDNIPALNVQLVISLMALYVMLEDVVHTNQIEIAFLALITILLSLLKDSVFCIPVPILFVMKVMLHLQVSTLMATMVH